MIDFWVPFNWMQISLHQLTNFAVEKMLNAGYRTIRKLAIFIHV